MKNPLTPVTKIDLDEAFDRYDEKSRMYRDQILTKMDGVMRELEGIREEQALSKHQTEVKIRRLDTRLTKIASRHIRS